MYNISSYYEVILSKNSLEQTEFGDISFKSQTVATNIGLQYFQAGVIQRDEVSDMKTFQFKEGVKIVAGLDVVLDTMGSFYVYARAVIDKKVGMINIQTFFIDIIKTKIKFPKDKFLRLLLASTIASFHL